VDWMGPAGEIVGSLMSGRSGRRANEAAWDRMKYGFLQQNIWRAEDRWDQYNFAHNAAGWRMKDIFRAADESGIHRLAALGGGQGASYTPGQQSPGGIPQPMATEGLGDAIGTGLRAISEARARSRAEKQATKESNARIKVDEAQARLYEARSRSEIANARAATLGGPAAKGEDDFAPKLKNVLEVVKTTSGKEVPVPVASDPGEMMMGALVDAIGDVGTLSEMAGKNVTYADVKRSAYEVLVRGLAGVGVDDLVKLAKTAGSAKKRKRRAARRKSTGSIRW